MRYYLDGNPNDPDTSVKKDMGFNIVDISIDRDTLLLYTTTNRVLDRRNGAVEVYDPQGWDSSNPDDFLKYTTNDNDFSGPAGISVGSLYKPARLNVWKQDDVTGDVGPGESITYDIRCSPTDANEYNVVVTDKLPDCVDFVSADSTDPNTGYYKPRPVHSYTWEIGFMQWADPTKPTAPADPNVYLELTVQVNDRAEPAGYVTNEVEAESDDSYALRVRKTEVCCWGGDKIFVVDVFATGYKTGVDWENAYTNLADALLRAGKKCGKKIWVAEGIYPPGDDTTDSFIIPYGVGVYGGFNGDEDPNTFDVAGRDYTAHETILTGYINETTRNRQVVTMGDETILDGFVVERGGIISGIYGEGVDFSIANCSVVDSTRYGIYCDDGNANISWCMIKNNGEDGIYSEASNKAIQVSNCRIFENKQNGIYTLYSAPTIINSMIYENGSEGTEYYGMSINQPRHKPTIRNNTIVHNSNEGIRFTDGGAPDIRNCILWYNNEDGGLTQLLGYDTAYYCCVTDPNDLVGSSTQVGPYYNITCNPNFAYSYGEQGYYHLDPGSNCVDTGDSSAVDPNNVGEYDIDGDDRIYGDDVDMGADEVACDEVSSERDFDGDGLIGRYELLLFSAVWLSHDPNDPLADPEHPDFVEDPNDPDYINPDSLTNWDGRFDLDTDYDVDLVDFSFFTGDWLWEACWRSSSEGTWMMMGMGGGDIGKMMDVQSQTIADRRLAELAALRESKPAPEPTIEEQLDNAKEIIKWLEEIWEEDEEVGNTIDEKDWEEFMDKIYEWLYELEAIYDDKSSE